MAADSFAELSKLTRRLESLGVKIEGGSAAEEPLPARRPATGHSCTTTAFDRALDALAPPASEVDSHYNFDESLLAPSVDGAEPACYSRVPRRGNKKTGKGTFVSAAHEGELSTDRIKGNPLSSLLADYREAETRWNRDRATLQRQLTAERKRANKLEAQFNRVKSMYEARTVDLKAMKSALVNRDEQVKVAVRQNKAVEDRHVAALERAASDNRRLKRERDELRALLDATLVRLETVDAVVGRVEQSNEALLQQVGALEGERDRAINAADEADARAKTLIKAQRHVEWQNQLLNKISEVQTEHNRQKTAALYGVLGAKALPMSETDVSVSGGARTDC